MIKKLDAFLASSSINLINARIGDSPVLIIFSLIFLLSSIEISQ